MGFLASKLCHLSLQEIGFYNDINLIFGGNWPLLTYFSTNYGKLWKSWEYQTTWPASWETYMQVRKQQLELDMEQ